MFGRCCVCALGSWQCNEYFPKDLLRCNKEAVLGNEIYNVKISFLSVICAAFCNSSSPPNEFNVSDVLFYGRALVSIQIFSSSTTSLHAIRILVSDINKLRVYPAKIAV